MYIVFNSGHLKLMHTRVQQPSSGPLPCRYCLLPLKNPSAPLSRNVSLSLSAPIPRNDWIRPPQVRAHLKNFQAQACKARDPSTPLHQPTSFPTPTSPQHHLRQYDVPPNSRALGAPRFVPRHLCCHQVPGWSHRPPVHPHIRLLAPTTGLGLFHNRLPEDRRGRH